MIRIENDVVLCICLLFLHDFKNSKRNHLFTFYRNSYTNNSDFLCEIFCRDFQKVLVSFHRFVIWSKSKHQINFTTMRSCKNLKKRWRYTINSNIHLFKRFATFLYRNDFAIIRKLINQKSKITYNAKTSNSKSFQQCMMI